MNAAEYLQFIEANAAYMDAITHIKNGLEQRGWTPSGSELAARELFMVMMSATIQAGGNSVPTD